MDELTGLFYQQILMQPHANAARHVDATSGWHDREMTLRSQLHAFAFGRVGMINQMRGLPMASRVNCEAALAWFAANVEWCDAVLRDRAQDPRLVISEHQYTIY